MFVINMKNNVFYFHLELFYSYHNLMPKLYGLNKKKYCLLPLRCVIYVFCLAPRLLFDGWTQEDYMVVFQQETALQNLAKTIVTFYKVSLLSGKVPKESKRKEGEKGKKICKMRCGVYGAN